jgi:hypothetical protein
MKKTIAFRNLGVEPVFGLKFYPFENSKIVTCGYENMKIWMLRSNSLSCRIYQKFRSQKPNLKNEDKPLRSVLMCMDFLNYKVGNTITSDVIYGTSEGEILTFRAGKLTLVQANAHDGAINCMCISDKLLQSSAMQ